MKLVTSFLAVTALSLGLMNEAEARSGDFTLDMAPESSMPHISERHFKTPEMTACLNRNTLTYTFATFFNQTKSNPHQFPDMTDDGEYLFLDMSHPSTAEASRNSLIGACAENPDLNLADYAIHNDYSGISGDIHESGFGRIPAPGDE